MTMSLTILLILCISIQLSNAFLHQPSSISMRSSLALTRTNLLHFPATGNLPRSSRLSMQATSAQNVDQVDAKGLLGQSLDAMKVVWDFTRPHTIIGSALSLTTLFLYATPKSMWTSPAFCKAWTTALVPSLLTNLYITGLNQVTDVEIDKVNKPYLPIASGKLSMTNGILLITASLLISLWYAYYAEFPLKMTILGSALLGTVYSMPPFRLKRYPLLAAFCILVVRGSIINLGFFLQAKEAILGNKVNSLSQVITQYPDSVYLTTFFAIFGVVIALMKDVPDIAGDIKNNIPTFSVRLGARKMFSISTSLLQLLLLAASGTIFSSTKGQLGVGKAILGAIPVLFALDSRQRAKKVDIDSPKDIFSYYMYVWNIFYACYVLLPFLN